MTTVQAALFDTAPLPEPTIHTLIPTSHEDEQRIRDRCNQARHVPSVSYNPWLDETFCVCGAARYRGDHRPHHEASCYDNGCRQDCPAACASFGWLVRRTVETGPPMDRRTVRRLDRLRFPPSPNPSRKDPP